MRLPFPITNTQDPRTNLQPPQRFQEMPREAQRESGPTVQDPPRSGAWKILDDTTQKSGDLGASQIPWAARDAGQAFKWTLGKKESGLPRNSHPQAIDHSELPQSKASIAPAPPCFRFALQYFRFSFLWIPSWAWVESLEHLGQYDFFFFWLLLR